MGNEELIKIKISFKDKQNKIECNPKMTIQDIIKYYLQNYLNNEYDLNKLILTINGVICYPDETLESYKHYINSNSVFKLCYYEKDKNNQNNRENECYVQENDYDGVFGDDIEVNYDDLDLNNIDKECFKMVDNKLNFNMEIDIKFFKTNKNTFLSNYNGDLFGLLKLCLLKEIAINTNFEEIRNVPINILNILTILKNGQLNYNNVQEGIVKALQQINGGNIINFSKYVDDLIKQSEINNYLISNLDPNLKNEITYIQNCLGKYNDFVKLFENELNRAKRNSVFEYSIISSVIIEVENIDNFENNQNKCKNVVNRVLFHGTSYDAISKILPGKFLKAHCVQHGQGVYFTEDLDSCWIYGSETNFKDPTKQGRNLNIPKVGEYLSLIANFIYYDQKKFKRLYKPNFEDIPPTNGVNFAYSEMTNLDTIENEIPDQTRFYGTEFVINDLNQICPFMSFKLKRDEYCIIWRDNNFSPNPIYNNEFDEIFKQFLKERIDYINQVAKYNVYPCDNSEKALRLIERKKYNKIILISNIGTDLGGKKFIEKARKIIKNDVIVLFLAYHIGHLDWVKDFNNALFSNETKFYEEYLDCFYGKNEKECKDALKQLKNLFSYLA